MLLVYLNFQGQLSKIDALTVCITGLILALDAPCKQEDKPRKRREKGQAESQ